MQYFDEEEFNCSCCGQNEMADEFKQDIDDARHIAEVPFVVTSGYRCKKHNQKVGGSETSSHLKGIAADIEAENSRDKFKIVEALMAVGFKRIGIGEDFIHVDKDEDKAQSVLWTYY